MDGDIKSELRDAGVMPKHWYGWVLLAVRWGVTVALIVAVYHETGPYTASVVSLIAVAIALNGVALRLILAALKLLGTEVFGEPTK